MKRRISILVLLLVSIISSAVWTAYRVYSGWVSILNAESFMRTEAFLRVRYRYPDLSLVWRDILIEFFGVALILFDVMFPLWVLINVLVRKRKRVNSE